MSTKRSYLVILLAIIILGSCVVEKKKGDLSATKKFYHNTTAYYNAFFNAEELMAESMLNMQSAHLDNYNQILSVYDYTKLQNPKVEAANLDKAIEKVSKSAAMHRQSHWVDDCYVVIGKAQFYKQDFETAEETLMFFQEEFDENSPFGKNYDGSKNASREEKKMQRKRDKKIKESEVKDKKKEKAKTDKEKKKAREEEQKARDKARKQAIKDRKNGIRPAKKTTTTDTKTGQEAPKTTEEKKIEEKEKEEEKEEAIKEGKFTHLTAYWDGLYWLGRTLIERENFSSAEYYFNKVSGSKAQSDIRNELPAARAHLHIKKKEYAEAIEHLESAILVTKDHFKKARYAYILAQIHERLGNVNAAFSAYEKSKSFKPDFEMAFYADLNEIKLSQRTGKISSDAAIKKMEKMAAEEKNNTYQTPIYFAIGEVLLADGSTEEAIAMFKKATSTGSGEDPELYYKLGKLLYDQEDYLGAKEYFDKALASMAKTDDRYAEVKNFSNSLKDVALAIKEIELQDSLLTLAALPEDELIERAKEAIKSAPIEMSVEPEGNKSSGVNKRYGSGRSSFFAYNPIAMNQGKFEFQRTWGERVLEDNWRRSAVGSTFFDESEDLAEGEVGVSKEQLEAFLSKLPRNKVSKDLAKRKMADARYNLGKLYRDRLENVDKSELVMDELIVDMPTFDKMDQVYFYQYLNNTDLNNTSEASRFKKLMLEKFPESNFTKIATDPNYVQQQIDEGNKLEKYYSSTYNMFESSQYENVLTRSEESIGMFGADNELAAKFSLLAALSTGYVNGKVEYIKALEQLVKRYPNTDEQKRAKEILRFLKGDVEAFDEILYDEENLTFEKDEKSLHYVVVILYNASGKEVDQTKINLLSFHKTYFKEDKLVNSNITLNRDLNTQLVLIRKFKDQEKVMAYYDYVIKNKAEYITSEISYDVYPVTQKNYREIMKQRSAKSYRSFFEANYK